MNLQKVLLVVFICFSFACPVFAEWNPSFDYDGSYTYGCGTKTSSSLAKYNNNNPLDLSS